ncbi:expressed protein [Dictyostelium purpureum]|uniref:Expressed protein n=1 Tax=Dictyostelium purpureum TaxID=5786 RepID=F0ZIQ7_DICPU|nr:uncharacterized protein DICPUDRAFT_91889 [Dictyostelium purpureum]EGC36165.1 expressed protein [Dictyostelium purpureum]|eukprot:XP_003287298.1 expressed protein [Dictyostelium purpureum]
MNVDEVSNLQHQPFTISLTGNVCNSTLTNTQVYTFGYGNGPECNLGSLYYSLQLSGNLEMNDKDGNTIYNQRENYVTISKNPSNNYYIMKIFSNSDN